jgi:SAM-dependent methyltransferase
LVRFDQGEVLTSMTNAQAPAAHLSRAAGRDVFGTDAAGYHASRSGYPDDLYDKVFARVGERPRVLEVAPGTGLATEALLARDLAALVIVESDPELAIYLKDRFPDPRVTVINASFPSVELDGPFDLITCAAAFHWMEPEPALARIQALLCPGGIWAMWWNSYCNPGVGDAFADSIYPMLLKIDLPPSWTATGHYGLDAALHTHTLSTAGFTDIESHSYRRERMLQEANIRTLYETYSFIRLLPANERASLFQSFSQIIAQDFRGEVPNVILTALYTSQKPL